MVLLNSSYNEMILQLAWRSLHDNIIVLHRYYSA